MIIVEFTVEIVAGAVIEDIVVELVECIVGTTATVEQLQITNTKIYTHSYTCTYCMYIHIYICNTLYEKN